MTMKRIVLVLFSLVCAASMLFAGGKQGSAGSDKPLAITMYYSDNATLPFHNDWLTVQEAQKRYNVKINWEIIPIADYSTKVSLALNSGNGPDVILYQSIAGENASLAMNGAIVPISDYPQWTPEWNARVQEFGIQADVDALKLKDGKRYSLPSLTDVPFYDGGLILREDVLAKYKLPAPKTYDDLYAVLKAYKADNPASYPLTVLVGPRVLYRMTQPAWGISLHLNGAGGSRVLSWDYSKNTFFAGAISEEYRTYLRFWHKLYAEGLLDPELEPVGDAWATKMATGKSIATYAYYDQIGGVEAAAEIPGFKLNMYPALAGPAGAHHQQKAKTGSGIIFPITTSKRADFERIVRTVDAMFFSKEAALLWCIGVEGQTYTMSGNTIKYADSILKSPDGIYKHMQLQYGAGSDVTQTVWVNAREMTKYDENYAKINQQVSAMGGVIQAIPPTPKFDDLAAEKATSLMGPLFDAFNVWDNAFITGTKNIDRDWAAYVAEMTQKGINDYLALYNSNL
ncbi:sugar ABC transporter substrate-binding protein [Spirochaetia bacterium]|nr:sugar ABC transporter substrate-binding protein [Spirochaetia bacterium]GHV52787.1 sugar ABC transporter substrate-binding protein [Spirochaetia bacterium]